MPPRNGAEFSPELKRLFIIAKSLKITSEHRRCAMSVVHGRCKTSIPSLSTPDVLESESYIEGYGQSYDAAPTVLLLFSGNFHPPESLRDPEGLRTCRPEAGLGFSLNYRRQIIFAKSLKTLQST